MPMHTLETNSKILHLKAVGFFKIIDHPVEGRIRRMQVSSTWSVTQPQAGGLAPSRVAISCREPVSRSRRLNA